MAMAAGKINEIRELIIAERYHEARALLKTSTHPKTDEWLVKLEQLTRQKTQPRRSQRDLQEMSPVSRKASQTTTAKIAIKPQPPKIHEKALYKDDTFTITR